MNNFHGLSEREGELKKGYLILDDTLLELDKGMIVDTWTLSGATIEEKVEEAREKAELSNRKWIYYDDVGYYNLDMVLDEGGLVSPFDIPLTEDEKSLIEYFTDR